MDTKFVRIPDKATKFNLDAIRKKYKNDYEEFKDFTISPNGNTLLFLARPKGVSYYKLCIYRDGNLIEAATGISTFCIFGDGTYIMCLDPKGKANLVEVRWYGSEYGDSKSYDLDSLGSDIVSISLAPDSQHILVKYKDGNYKKYILNRKLISHDPPEEHVVARSNEKGTKNPAYPDKNIESPVEFTHEKVLEKPVWADPEKPDQDEILSRFSYYGPLILGKDGRPENPVESTTGMTGRGLLGKWGPNHAGDPIVTRINDSGNYEIVLIQRKDTDEWAIPGGMVDPGETGTETAAREFNEEAGDTIKNIKSIEIYTGYVDDPRNTDNSWMETACYHFHIGTDNFVLRAGDDAKNAKWTEYSPSLKLYASHKQFIDKAIKLHKIANNKGINYDRKLKQLLEFNEPITATFEQSYGNKLQLFWNLKVPNSLKDTPPSKNLKNRNELSYISVSGGLRFSRSLRHRRKSRRRSRSRRHRRRSRRRSH